MNDYIIIHEVFLSGSRENIINMLNTAIHSIGGLNVIREGDDIETINNKVGACHDNDAPKSYTLVDFLNEESRVDNPIQEKILEGQRLKKELEKDGQDPVTCCDYDVRIYEVVASDSRLTVSLGMSYHDWYYSYDDDDWENWAKDIVRIYGCKIVMDVVCSCNGTFDGITTFIIELKDDVVEQTRIQPEVDFNEYHNAFDKLMKIDSVRYLQFKIDDFEEKVSAMQSEIERMKSLLEEEKKKPKLPVVCAPLTEETNKDPQIEENDDLPF